MVGQAHQDGADLARRQRRDRRRIAEFDDLGRHTPDLGGDVVRQCLDVGRRTALPFVFVHLTLNICCAAQHRDGIVLLAAIYAANPSPGRRLRAWVHPAAASSQSRDRAAQKSPEKQPQENQAFGRFFSRARFGSSAGHCTM
jgi:hypothetical protein